MNNYRPLSKTSSKVVHLRVLKHLNRSDEMAKIQFACSKIHNTDQGTVQGVYWYHCRYLLGCNVWSTILKLSVDHDILISRLAKSHGFSGWTIEWLSLYLSNRTFRVQLAGQLSTPVSVKCDVRFHKSPSWCRCCSSCTRLDLSTS